MKQMYQLYILVCYKGWKIFLKRALGGKEKSLNIPFPQNSFSGKILQTEKDQSYFKILSFYTLYSVVEIF